MKRKRRRQINTKSKDTSNSDGNSISNSKHNNKNENKSKDERKRERKKRSGTNNICSNDLNQLPQTFKNIPEMIRLKPNQDVMLVASNYQQLLEKHKKSVLKIEQYANISDKNWRIIIISIPNKDRILYINVIVLEIQEMETKRKKKKQKIQMITTTTTIPRRIKIKTKIKIQVKTGM